jgi:uncharacterized membrane protein YccC
MDWPTWRDAVFSLRTFCAAMLAAWISLRLDLPSPGTAMMTVYIVSQPLTGMMLSKSVYRVFGTLAGGLATLFFIDLFAQARELFVLAAALWFGGCIYISVLLRDAPAAYGPMLAGYTAAIIGFPTITAPETVFDTTVNRCTEILMGIGCAGLLSAIVLPRPVGPILQERIEAVLQTTAKRAVDILRGQGAAEAGRTGWDRLIADAMALETLRSHAVFDTRAVRLANDVVRQLQGRLFTFLAVLVSVQDRASLLRRRDPVRFRVITPAFEAVAQVMDRSLGPAQPKDEESIGQVRRLIESLQPFPEEVRRDEPAIFARISLDRLQDLLSLRADCLELRDHLLAGSRPRSMGPAPSISRHRDQGVAVIAGVTAFATLAIGCAFWIGTGWSNGAAAATMIVVSWAIFSVADEPALTALDYFRMTAAAVVLSLIYVTLLLPQFDGFAMLAAALALYLVPAGMLISAPRIGLAATPMTINFLFLLSLGRAPSLDFAAHLNNAIAVLVGIAIAVALVRLFWPLGTQWAARRLVTAIMADLARLASGVSRDPDEFASRMFDRINGLFLRLDQTSPGNRPILQGSLASLRIGHNILTLRRLGSGLPPSAGRAVETALVALAGHFTRAWRRSDVSGRDVTAALLRAEAGLRALDPVPDVVATLVSVAAIRVTLAHHSQFFSLPQPDGAPLIQDMLAPT